MIDPRLPELGPRDQLLPPSGIIITPSNINPWRSTRSPDQLFTHAQLALAPSYKLDPATCDFVIVRQVWNWKDGWWPTTSKPPIYLLPCPIITRGADGERLLVLSPAGMKKWVFVNGSITRRGFEKAKAFAARQASAA